MLNGERRVDMQRRQQRIGNNTHIAFNAPALMKRDAPQLRVLVNDKTAAINKRQRHLAIEINRLQLIVVADLKSRIIGRNRQISQTQTCQFRIGIDQKVRVINSSAVFHHNCRREVYGCQFRIVINFKPRIGKFKSTRHFKLFF